MPQHDRPQTRAVRRDAAPAPGAGRRRHPADTADQLRHLSDELDTLQRDVSTGARNAAEHERNVDRAERIADGLRALFRGGSTRPPLWISADGRSAAW